MHEQENNLMTSSNETPHRSLFSTLARTTVKYAVLGTCLNLALRKVLHAVRHINLQDRVILITGATSGHGLILAKHAAAYGAILILVARTEEDLARVRSELLEKGAKEVLIVKTDIRDYVQVKELIERAIHQFGKIDILINNAGIMGVGPAEKMSLEDFDNYLSSNFWGALYLIHEVLPHMKKRKFGRIANIISIGGKRAVPHMLPYTVSKFALAGLSQGIGTELAKDNIHVTGVYPSIMRSGGHTHAWFKGNQSAEYCWFGILANTPIISSSPHTVASKVWEAVCNGDPEVHIGLPSKMTTLLQTICPNLMADFLSVVNRVLPEGVEGGSHEVKGESLSGVIPGFLNRAVSSDVRPQNQH